MVGQRFLAPLIEVRVLYPSKIMRRAECSSEYILLGYKDSN